MDSRDYNQAMAYWAPILRSSPMAMNLFQRSLFLTGKNEAGEYEYFESLSNQLKYLGYEVNDSGKRAMRMIRCRLLDVGAWREKNPAAPGRCRSFIVNVYPADNGFDILEIVTTEEAQLPPLQRKLNFRNRGSSTSVTEEAQLPPEVKEVIEVNSRATACVPARLTANRYRTSSATPHIPSRSLDFVT